MLNQRCYSLGERYLAAAMVPMATPPAMTAICTPMAAVATAADFRPLMNEEDLEEVAVLDMMSIFLCFKHNVIVALLLLFTVDICD